jgi:hypothetical protein
LQKNENFISLKPKRLDFEWYTNREGLVRIRVPKFRSNLGKSFCKLIKKENTFTTNLDIIGSLVWKNCDGEKTVGEILERLKKEFPKEENLEARLILFIQQMRNLRYIDY